MKEMTLEMQMELTLANASKTVNARKTRTRRAGWWFGQMRSAVNKAMDWKPRPAPPSHQVYLSLDRGEPKW
jgi:hypothetical protein